MTRTPHTSIAAAVGEAFEHACLEELAALKPGNVHVYAAGHGMTLRDFEASAAVTAEVMARPGLSVGERIYESVEATNSAVGCNTNLGIVLLSAPLAQAVLGAGREDGLRERLRRVLGALTVADAHLAYRAIRLASPAGLGTVTRHDVAAEPTVTLREAMAAAAGRDRIACQYAAAYEDVFAIGVPRIGAALCAGVGKEWAATLAYLGFLGSFNDSHIERKYSCAAAAEVRSRAMALDREAGKARDPSALAPALLAFDAELKEKNLNPGTSADLTVASLLAVKLEDILRRPISA